MNLFKRLFGGRKAKATDGAVRVMSTIEKINTDIREEIERRAANSKGAVDIRERSAKIRQDHIAAEDVHIPTSGNRDIMLCGKTIAWLREHEPRGAVTNNYVTTMDGSYGVPRIGPDRYATCPECLRLYRDMIKKTMQETLTTPIKGETPVTTTVKDAGDRLTQACYMNSLRSGWHDDPKTGLRRTVDQNEEMFPTRIALCHSELSEALEGHRKGLMDDHLKHRAMAEVELADAIIRIFDLAGAMGYDLGSTINEKLAYNAERADHKREARLAEGGKKY